MAAKLDGTAVTPQARAAGYVLAACKILKNMHTPTAKKVLEELEPYIYELASLPSGSRWKPERT